MRKKGFSLIEMIVVVGIIGLLAAAATLAYNKQRVRSREARRVEDIAAVKNALELYLTEGNSLPAASGETLISSSLTDLVTKGIINSLPADPLPTTATDHPYCRGYAYWTNVTLGSFKGANIGTVRYSVNFGSELTPLTGDVHPLNSAINSRSGEFNCNNSRYHAVLFEK